MFQESPWSQIGTTDHPLPPCFAPPPSPEQPGLQPPGLLTNLRHLCRAWSPVSRQGLHLRKLQQRALVGLGWSLLCCPVRTLYGHNDILTDGTSRVALPPQRQASGCRLGRPQGPRPNCFDVVLGVIGCSAQPGSGCPLTPSSAGSIPGSAGPSISNWVTPTPPPPTRLHQR